MTVPALIAELRRRDIRIRTDGDRLHLNAPADAVTPELRERLRQCKLDIITFLDAARSLARQQPAVVPLQPQGTQPPIFGVGGHNGDVFCYGAFARHLGSDQPIYGLQPPGLEEGTEPLSSVEDLAAYFTEQIRAFRSGAPCVVAGYCAGGAIAFELARQLRAAGVDVRYLAMLGAPYPARYRRLTLWREQQVERFSMHVRALRDRSPLDWSDYFASRLRDRRARRSAAARDADDPVLVRRRRVERATLSALRSYRPASYAGTVGLFLPRADWAHGPNEPLRWLSVAPSAVEYCGPAECRQSDMLLEPHAPRLAELYRCALREAGLAP